MARSHKTGLITFGNEKQDQNKDSVSLVVDYNVRKLRMCLELPKGYESKPSHFDNVFQNERLNTSVYMDLPNIFSETSKIVKRS